MKEGLLTGSYPIIATNFAGKETRFNEEGQRTICLGCSTEDGERKYIHPKIFAIMELYKKEADGSFTKLSSDFRRRLDRRPHTNLILTAKDSGEKFKSPIYDEMCSVLDEISFMDQLMLIEYRIRETSVGTIQEYRLYELKATVSDEDLNKVKESRP